MQATTINNLKGIDQFGQDDKQGKALKKDAQLRARNLKRYINQCTVAKAQCERRIKMLGGPDYTNPGGTEIKQTGQEKVKPTQKLSKPQAKVLSFTEVMDNSLARSFFMLFLQNKTGSKNMLMLVPTCLCAWFRGLGVCMVQGYASGCVVQGGGMSGLKYTPNPPQIQSSTVWGILHLQLHVYDIRSCLNLSFL